MSKVMQALREGMRSLFPPPVVENQSLPKPSPPTHGVYRVTTVLRNLGVKTETQLHQKWGLSPEIRKKASFLAQREILAAVKDWPSLRRAGGGEWQHSVLYGESWRIGSFVSRVPLSSEVKSATQVFICGDGRDQVLVRVQVGRFYDGRGDVTVCISVPDERYPYSVRWVEKRP